MPISYSLRKLRSGREKLFFSLNAIFFKVAYSLLWVEFWPGSGKRIRGALPRRTALSSFGAPMFLMHASVGSHERPSYSHGQDAFTELPSLDAAQSWSGAKCQGTTA